MHPVIQKTLGGLSAQFYFRQLFFGVLMAALVIFITTLDRHSNPVGMYFFFAVCTLLYPYSRFVYESVVGFVMGNNVFFVNAMAMLFSKLITMIICWVMAIFIAPVGLAYLYFHHSKAAEQQVN